MAEYYSQARVRRCLEAAFNTEFIKTADGSTIARRKYNENEYEVDITNLDNPLNTRDLNYVLHHLGIPKPVFWRSCPMKCGE